MRLLLLFTLLATPTLAAPTLPAKPIPPVARDPKIPVLRAKIARAQVFSAYRELIEIHKRAGLVDEAARLHRAQIPLYRAKGLNDAAILQENAARALETDVRAFVDTPTTRSTSKGARLEPAGGAYLSAFIDRDDSLGPAFVDENFQTHRTPAQFQARTGVHPASLWMYLAYGNGFPKAWLERLKASECIPQIAWEPRDLRLVRDDAYLRTFARNLAKLDHPVFIRFASEMNGAWTSWGGNPSLYKEKFRLVHRVMREEAPRVATMWVVNNPPLGNAFSYYPGDDGCDWVGVNFYSTPFVDGNRNRPNFHSNPLALLDPIYKRFAAKKPIAVCEFAASHFSPVDRIARPDFAVRHTRLLYGALPLLYPRVKMIGWFSMDTIRFPTPGKTRNNYQFTSHPDVLRAWRAAVDTPHFLQRAPRITDELPPIARPLNGQVVSSTATLRFWARAFDANSRLFVAIDNRVVWSGSASGAGVFRLQTKPGAHQFEAWVFDSRNRFLKKTSARFVVR